MEKTEEDYEKDIEEIEKMFPNAKFSVAIELEDLDDIVTDETDIVVKNTYDCYCHTNKRNTEYFYISGKHITNKFIIYKLIEQGLDLDCDHRFLEGFCKSKDSNCQFEISTGS